MEPDDFTYAYKYLPFDDGSINVLTNGTLKYTCPLEFNDPFDCRPTYSPASIENVGKHQKELLKRAGRRAGLSPAESIRQRGKNVKKLQKYLVSGNQLKDLLKTVGVVSLSSVPDNILMWSHYANFHKGFLVEFKLPRYGFYEDALNPGYSLIAQDVHYSDERPELNYGMEDSGETIKKTLLTKSALWKYESEVRVIDAFRGPGIHEYNRKLISSVIAGMNMSPSQFSRLREVVEHAREHSDLAHVELYRAKPCERHYKVLIPGHPKSIIESR